MRLTIRHPLSFMARHVAWVYTVKLLMYPPCFLGSFHTTQEVQCVFVTQVKHHTVYKGSLFQPQVSLIFFFSNRLTALVSNISFFIAKELPWLHNTNKMTEPLVNEHSEQWQPTQPTQETRESR